MSLLDGVRKELGLPRSKQGERKRSTRRGESSLHSAVGNQGLQRRFGAPRSPGPVAAVPPLPAPPPAPRRTRALEPALSEGQPVNAEKRGEPGPGPETQGVVAPEPVHSADSPPAGGAWPGAPAGSSSGHSAILEQLLVPDSVSSVDSSQMRKGDFLLALQAEVTNAAEEELARADRTIGNCPWIDYWFAYYRRREPAHVARAVVKYAPEAASAGSLSGAIAAVARRARESVRSSLAAGRPIGAPAGIPESVFDPRSAQRVPSGEPPVDPVLNTPPDAPRDLSHRVPLGLGDGRPLETTTRTRMEAAFGTDLTGVRVHTDARGQTAAGHERARAFAYGTDVAFAPGQHRPGTLVGDALLAHELAHVLQQKTATGGSASSPHAASRLVDGAELEADANRAAASALGLTPGLDGSTRTGPRHASELRLARCGEEDDRSVLKTVSLKVIRMAGFSGTPDPDADIAFGNSKIFPKANMKLDKKGDEKLDEERTEELIGENQRLASPKKGFSSEEKRVRSALGSEDVIPAVYLKEIQSSFVGLHLPGNCSAGHVVLVENGADQMALTHEVGHALGLPHRETPKNFMNGNAGTSDTKVEEPQIPQMRSSEFAQ